MTTAREDALNTVAVGPASATVDGDSATAQDISKIIEADRYLGSKTAALKNHFGIHVLKIQPPGAG